MTFQEMFAKIDAYQVLLGYDPSTMSKPQRIAYARECSLALFMEVAELVESTPWKPWRAAKDQLTDLPNLEREAIDIIFFLHHIVRCYDITASDLEDRFNVVLQNNMGRIHNGYSKLNTTEKTKRG